MSMLSQRYFETREGIQVVFNVTLALKHPDVSNIEPFDAVIHLVSHPLVGIEALAKLPRHLLDSLLPQPFAAANQTALHRAMVHWVALNSLLEMISDTRIRVEDLGGAVKDGVASFLLNISVFDRKTIGSSLPSPTISWKDLQAEDNDLAALVCRTGMRYGYNCTSL